MRVASMSSARFLLRPRWLLSHLLVALLVVVMVNLGFWQLRRLDERRERNALIEDRQSAEVVPVEDVLAPDDGAEAVDAARYRAVDARGRYDNAATVEVRNRSQDGVAGAWLLTPLLLDSGGQVGVIRGFVPLGDDGQPVAVSAPRGDVTVEGWVARPGGFDGTAPRDIEPLVELPGTLPAVVLAESSRPAEAGDQIVPVPLPDLDEGPHLSYAIQWFIFSAIAVGGYPLVLRRLIRQRGREDDADTGSAGSDGGRRRPSSTTTASVSATP